MLARLIAVVLILFLGLPSTYAQKKSPFPRGTKRVLFLGNSITYAGSYISNVEAYLRTRYPNQSIEFINAGLPSETVSGLTEDGHANGKFPRPDLHERLGRVLAQTKPDVVFACYGMNDGIYLPLDETRFAAYRRGMQWLHTELKKAKVRRIVFLTPPIHDDSKLGLQGYNLTLDRYAEWLLAQRKQWEVADIHFPMKAVLETRRQTEPTFKLATDGVHPGELGHWLMAKSILKFLGEPVADTASVASIGTPEMVSLIRHRQALMKDAWLTATGHTRPEMTVGLPLPEARRAYESIENQLKNPQKKRIRIACVGNSITQGVGVNVQDRDSYPGQLQRLLGYGYDVQNFGVSGRTSMRAADRSYAATPQYQAALRSNPDLVMIKLGTNDSRLPYRTEVATQFINDYTAIVQSFQNLPSRPRIVLLLPVASYLTDTIRQTDQAIQKWILPRIRQIAYDHKLELIDLHALTMSQDSLFPDGLHPNLSGAKLIAQRLYEALTAPQTTDFDSHASLNIPYQTSSFYGYDCANFTFEGHSAKIVKPRRVAAGKPWIWRARFWGHEPQTDIALLDRGFHLVYCDVAELYGNEAAITRWNHFYDLMTKVGLSPKVVLEALSRGGVYAYNWAVRNPEKVACVYADAPVLDLRSWPGGKGKGPGSKADWEIFKKDYGFTTDEETATFRHQPMDQVEGIVKGNFPMLHVVGDADEVVPVSENTTLFEQKVKALGGRIEVIHKPGVGHHPHSLANPQPIVDFILKAVREADPR